MEEITTYKGRCLYQLRSAIFEKNTRQNFMKIRHFHEKYSG